MAIGGSFQIFIYERKAGTVVKVYTVLKQIAIESKGPTFSKHLLIIPQLREGRVLYVSRIT